VNIRRRPSLRAALEQLALDFADAILAAASAEVIATLGAPIACRTRSSASRQNSDALLAASRSRTSRSPRSGRSGSTPVGREAAQVEESVEDAGAYPDTVIIDPLAVLGAMEQPARSPEIPTVAPEVEVVQRASEERAPATPAARAGEDIVRVAGGGVVLLRRRSARSSDARGGSVR
jgi:hypothetical protein